MHAPIVKFPVAAATCVAAFLAGTAVVAAQQPAMEPARANMVDAEGKSVGTVELMQAPSGVMIRAVFQGLPQGTHGFHIHTTGKCEPPFDSAGGHFNPTDAKHGFMTEGGPHAGDMPNINVPESGELTVDVFNTMVTLADGDNALLDDDGAALMIHAGADDHASDPAGDSGSRIACGVIETMRGAGEGTSAGGG